MRKLRDRVVFCAVVVLVIGCSGSTGPKQAATPAAIISIDTIAVLPGSDVTINLRLARTEEANGPRLDSLSAFEFLACYDDEFLDFMICNKGPAISQWEYFTFRTMSTSPCSSCGLRSIRVIAMRDLNNGVAPDPPQYFPEGVLATLSFFVSGDFAARGTVARVGFCLQSCRDNTMTPVAGNGEMLYAPDTTLGQILHMSGYDTITCPQFSRSPAIEFRGGWIRIEDPSRPLRGDVDLNRIAYEVHDAEIFSNYFSVGYAAFDPEKASEQIAATDCDGNGEPLTRADLGVMIRTITGEDPLGDSLSVPYKDTLMIYPRREGDRWILSCASTIQLDELWLRIVPPGAPGILIHYLDDPAVVVSSSSVEYWLLVACGTVEGRQIFGPERRDRFEIQGYSGDWLSVVAQASRYPGVSMTVRVVQPVNGTGQMMTVGGMAQ